MTATEEASRIVLDLRRYKIGDSLALDGVLWERLMVEMHEWCLDRGVPFLSSQDAPQPNFQFRGLWVYPVGDREPCGRAG